MPDSDADARMARMLFMTIFRWEAARLGLESLARLVTFDAEPTTAERTRGQHYRNGCGALLSFTGEAAMHGNSIVSCWEAARNPARSELTYAVSELRKAGLGGSATRLARRAAPVLVVATCAALVVRARD
jgi:hypothetical protein